ncbi:MAG: OsmC family protein [candidate division Zixibacteria bacterium]|nr:OsmC family protein [candidate division Zixibacteria bacterium]MDH3936721.1 OsmC family protein [candidate division Zixibacteria bacterium]MDH4032574.1 OsmC family protein [candidate division Zixibacteria bacterium]
MPVRKAHAVWEGNLPSGKGTIAFGSGAFEGAYSFGSRFEGASGTNPEELVAAAHAGCFSMALSHELAVGGHKPTSVKTDAKVHLDKVEDGFKITSIELICEAVVPDISESTFMKFANNAKTGCPISQALSAVEIKLDAKLVALV